MGFARRAWSRAAFAFGGLAVAATLLVGGGLARGRIAEFEERRAIDGVPFMRRIDCFTGECATLFELDDQRWVVTCEQIRPAAVGAEVVAAGDSEVTEARPIVGLDPSVVLAVTGEGCGPNVWGLAFNIGDGDDFEASEHATTIASCHPAIAVSPPNDCQIAPGPPAPTR